MAVLGIDWGEKYVGTAIAREGIALPAKTISLGAVGVSELQSMCRMETVTDVVMGKPFASGGGADNVSNRWNGAKNEFTAWCAERGIAVHEMDERMTSALAKKIIVSDTGPRGLVSRARKKDSRKKNLNGRVDKHAASILLQNFIDARK